MTYKTTLSLVLLLTVGAFFGGILSSGGSVFQASTDNNQLNFNNDQLRSMTQVSRLKPLDYAIYKINFYSPLSPDGKTVLDKYAKFFDGSYIPPEGEEGYYRIANSAQGDVDGDGVYEGVAMKVHSEGGTGKFPELVVLKNKDGEFKEVASISEPVDFFYDRIVTESITIDKGVITVNILSLGPNDGACCPTQPMSMKFKYVNNKVEFVL